MYGIQNALQKRQVFSSFTLFLHFTGDQIDVRGFLQENATQHKQYTVRLDTIIKSTWSRL